MFFKGTLNVAWGNGEMHRGLFVHMGSFSHINENIKNAFGRVFPLTDLKTFDIGQEFRKSKIASSRVMISALAEYGLGTIANRELARYRYLRSSAFFKSANALVKHKFGNGNFDFVLQTQSLFSAALPSCPNFVYTDHVACAALLETANPKTGRPSQRWINHERSIYENSAHVFTFGPKIRDLVVDYYGIPKTKASAIGAGASVMPTSEVSTDLNRYASKNILFVGVEWERKGGPELVEAFKKVRYKLPDATLTIIGCSPDLNVEGCRVLGRLPLPEVEPYFHEASCFCMPSRLEPFGIVYLEAMQFALPIVAANVSDLASIVDDGKTGRLVPAKDSEALADALINVLENKNRCRELGIASLERGKDFTWDEIVRKIGSYFPVPETR